MPVVERAEVSARENSSSIVLVFFLTKGDARSLYCAACYCVAATMRLMLRSVRVILVFDH